MSDDNSSDLSSLSSLSPAPSNPDLEDTSDLEAPAKQKNGILKFFPKLSGKPKEPSPPPPRKRSPSPPHEYVLADEPNIAFIVMFRNRFSDVLPKSLAHFGPQELERDVVESIAGERAEHLLCAVLGLLLNRKQDVKPGHYGRALEDAVSSNKNQWPQAWNGKNPLSGGATFNTMTPTERLTLLRTLILWAMSSSDALKTAINQSYKQNRHENDLNQPRAVQSWGSDADKRRYFLVEGEDDTHFRVYRESNPISATRTWWSVAGSIEELTTLSNKLETKDGGPKAKQLSQKILAAIPRFEAGEDKRKRREYRQMRKEQFKRPEPGFSMYEGRTRGKRMKYTYSDDEDNFYTDSSTRRSARNTGTATPAEAGPVKTMSGRQIRAPPRLNPVTGENASVQGDSELDRDIAHDASSRARRSSRGTSRTQRSLSVESDAELDEGEYGDDEDDNDDNGDDAKDGDAHASEESEDEDEFDEVEAMVEDDLDDAEPQSLVVKLKVTPPRLRNALGPKDAGSLNSLTQSVDRGGIALERKTSGTISNSQVQDEINAKPLESSQPESQSEETEPALEDEEVKTRSTPEPPNAVTNGFQAVKEPKLSSAALAFRGSPEKPQPAVPVHMVDVGEHN